MKVEPGALAEARKVTAMIFKEAGLQADWINCLASEADCKNASNRPQFWVRIVLPDREKGIDPKGEVLGFAMPCGRTDRACLVYVLYSHVSAHAKEHCVSPGLILGHVIAHEIGHSLLGPNGHTLWGVMQAGLPIEEVGRLLYFTPAQTERLRTELWVRTRSADKEPIGSTLP